MGKKRRKPPTMPHWFWWGMDGCWFCQKYNNCSQCKAIRDYRKQNFPKKAKGRHDEPRIEEE